VLYFAGYKTIADRYRVADIERAAGAASPPVAKTASRKI
jgi:hypothetical protein